MQVHGLLRREDDYERLCGMKLFRFGKYQPGTIFIKQLKGKESETVKPCQNESVYITKLFSANFMQIGL